MATVTMPNSPEYAEPCKKAWQDGGGGSDQDGPVSFKTLAEETTLHGISKAVNSKYSWFRRIFWLLVLLVMLGMLIRVLTVGIMTYLEYPSNTKISVQPAANITPPAITICNNNKLRTTHLYSHDNASKATEWFQSYQPTLGVLPDLTTMDPEVLAWVNSTDAVTYFRQGMAPAEEVLQFCTFEEQWVPCADIAEVVLTLDGFCYQISSRKFDDVSFKRPGHKYGINFQMDVQEYYYGGFATSPGVGAQVMIHDMREYPASTRLVSARPGTEIHMALTMQETKRLGIPWSNSECRDNMTVTDYRLSSRYTKEGCLMECLLKHFNIHCHCDMLGDHPTLPNCTLLQQYTCSYPAYAATFIQGRLSANESCGCDTACTESVFHVDLSAMSYPSTFVGNWVHSMYGVGQEYMRENLFRIYVYFRTLDVEYVEQQKSYTLNQFAADVGGQMGLFLGASIITVSEFIEFILVFCLEKCKAKKITRVAATTSTTKLQRF